MPNPTITTGARAILKLDGGVMVYATSVSYSIETTYQEIRVVDDSLPVELAPSQIRVSVVCNNLRVPKQSAAVLALQPTILNNLEQKYISIELRDRGTDDVLLFVPKAMLTSVQGSVSARSLASETWSLVGIGYWNERPPEAAQPNTSGNVIGQIADLAKSTKTPVG